MADAPMVERLRTALDGLTDFLSSVRLIRLGLKELAK